MENGTNRTIVVVALAFGVGALASHGLRAGEPREPKEAGAAPARSSADAERLDGLALALADVSARLRSLESGPRRIALREASAMGVGEAGEGGDRAKQAVAVVDASDERVSKVGSSEWVEIEKLLDGIVARGWSFDSGSGGMERYLELARDDGLIDDLIAHREATVASDPADTAAHMSLADAYVGKIMTLSGPEQGIWGAKAENQWQEVVALDDGHWRAHVSLGKNYCFYPDALGKTEDAIHHLEEAREIQSYEEPRPDGVDTYLMLARMYLRDGRRDEARSALEDGLLRHSGEDALMDALDRLGDD